MNRYFIIFYSGSSVNNSHQGYIGEHRVDGKYINKDDITKSIIRLNPMLISVAVTNVTELNEIDYNSFFGININ